MCRVRERGRGREGVILARPLLGFLAVELPWLREHAGNDVGEVGDPGEAFKAAIDLMGEGLVVEAEGSQERGHKASVPLESCDSMHREPR